MTNLDMNKYNQTWIMISFQILNYHKIATLMYDTEPIKYKDLLESFVGGLELQLVSAKTGGCEQYSVCSL